MLRAVISPKKWGVLKSAVLVQLYSILVFELYKWKKLLKLDV